MGTVFEPIKPVPPMTTISSRTSWLVAPGKTVSELSRSSRESDRLVARV